MDTGALHYKDAQLLVERWNARAVDPAALVEANKRCDYLESDLVMCEDERDALRARLQDIQHLGRA
jgi:hypothetical protein